MVNLTFLLAFSSCFSATTRPINLFTTATSSNAYIYVNSTLAGSIQTEILQYKADLETDGYNVTVYKYNAIDTVWFYMIPMEEDRFFLQLVQRNFLQKRYCI